MEVIAQYDKVLLKDGREGIVVEILGEQELFITDIGASPDDWETIEVTREEIKEVIN